ncbi:MAG TPA: hypothetical protein VJ123_06415 [Anaerolineales bacterium]|nr:hypothetical protein [Anaerolineales bacterium]
MTSQEPQANEEAAADSSREPSDMQPETPPSPAEAETLPPRPDRLRVVLRLAMRWAIAALAVFLLGVLATVLVQVRPQSVELRSLRDGLSEAQATAEGLQGQVKELGVLQSQNASLQKALEQAEQHLTLLKALVDVATAQAAIARSDMDTVRASLSGTDSRLAVLAAAFAGEEQNAVIAMRDRLELVFRELESDAFAAGSDLQVLASSLTALERSLYGD